MTTSLFTLVILTVMCAIAGFVVGLGVLLVQDYPKVGEFLKRRPVVGWTLAGAAGGAATLLLIMLFDFTVVLLLSLVR